MPDPITMAEKRAIIQGQAKERKQPDTMFARAQTNEERGAEMGRFRHLTQHHIVGTTPVYPKLRGNNSFAVGLDQLTGIEPPLGFSVEEMEPIETCAAVQSEPCQPPSEDQHQDGPSLVDAGPHSSSPREPIELSSHDSAALGSPTLPAASSSTVGRVSNQSKFRRRV